MTLKYNLKQREIGLNFSPDGKAEFLLWAPLAEKTEVLINGVGGYYPEPVGEGYWSLTHKDLKPGVRYRIKINDEALPDPASLSQPEGVHHSSEAADLNAFRWDDADWKGPEKAKIIFYELHTGTFSHEGNFRGIAGKLDHLKDLGITAIEIMPVAQFPGSRNWGYDGVYPFSVQNSYGGAAGLQELVNICHKNGLAVILDVVYNHLGPEGNYLNEFGPYFTDKYKTPWGKAINFDDEWCDGVRRFYIENMLMWLRDFHIDGLRLDAVHAIKDFSAKHILQELREYADALQDVTGRKYLLIAESDLNDTRFVKTPEQGGYGLDMQWCDEFHHALHALVTGERNGYYEDFGDTWQLIKTLNRAYVYDGIYSSHRKKTFGSSTDGIPGNKFVVFTQNHDHIGNRMMGERIGEMIGFETLKLVAGTMFVSNFVPLIFMGEEYNDSHPFLYFTSHTDEELQELVREGRKREFSEFMAQEEVPDPQSEAVFNKSKLDEDFSGSQKLLFEFYKKLINLKKNHPVWKSYDRSHTNAVSADEKLIYITKKIDNNQLIAILNYDSSEKNVTLPSSGGRKLFVLIDSAAQEWGGNQTDPDIAAGKVIKVMPSSIVVLSDVPENE